MNDDPTLAGDAEDDTEITHGDEHDDAVLAADDTGMLAGERLITTSEIAQGEHAGDV